MNWMFELNAPEGSPKRITNGNIQYAILERLDAIAKHLLEKGEDGTEGETQASLHSVQEGE